MSKLLPAEEKHLPENARPIVKKVEAMGFRLAGFDLEFPTPPFKDGIQGVRRLQIREDSHIAISREVTRYAELMSKRVPFPPILVTRDGFLVDGNTRAAAASKLGLPTIHALVIDEDGAEGNSKDVRSRLRGLGAALNTSHGKGLDKTELVKLVLDLYSVNHDAVKIAEVLGQLEKDVFNILSEQRGREIAEENGIHVNGSVPATQWRKLGQQRGDKPMYLPAWLDLVRLTQDAKLTAADLGVLIKKVNAAESDAVRVALIAEDRKHRAAEINEFKERGKVRSTNSGQLRRHVGFIVGFEGSEGDLVEYSPSAVGKHKEEISKAIAVLQKVLDKQEESRVGG